MNGETKLIRTMCPVCDAESAVRVNTAEWQAWKDGALIQDAFPNLSANTREALMTGTCDKCWAEMEELTSE